MKLPGSVTILFSVILLLFAVFSGQLDLKTFFEKDSSVQGVNTQSIEADEVAEIVDGDTFTLGNGEKVRLIGINTPENGQPYYEQAKFHLESLLSTKSVKLITDTQVQDQYGRILAYVYNESDLDINLEMIKSGYAVVDTVPPNVSRAEIFVASQVEARNNCVGIWEGLCGGEGLCVQISEIQSESEDGTKNGEWIEFSNTCATAQNLNGYLVKDNSASNNYSFGNVTLEPRKSVKLFSGCGTNSDKSLYWTCPEQNSFVWNDTGDRAYLYNTEGKLISELGY